MQRLKLAASKIPIELMERLNRLTELTGLTQSAAIRQAIEFYLDNAELTGLAGLTAIEGNLTPSQLVTTDNSVNSRLTDVEARLAALESAAVTNSPNTKPKSNTKKASPSPTSPAPTSPIAGAMTIGELFKVLEPLGYLSLKTLSRHLNKAIATQKLPDDLIRLGVVADWETRAKANRYSNQVRWLRLK
jgi:predicted DNA-binding protein